MPRHEKINNILAGSPLLAISAAIKTRIIKGKIKDDYFVFTRRNVSPFWFIINGFGKKTARLGVLNNGDLIVDSRHVIVATIIILPFTGGREQQYDLIFTKQLGSR